MGIPVAIPASPLAVNDTQNAFAEAVVAALGQVMQRGTSGSSVTTPPTYVPDPPVNPTTQRAVSILTASQQLFFRQLALAFIQGLHLPGPNFVDFYNPGLADGGTAFTLPELPVVGSVMVWRGPVSAMVLDRTAFVDGAAVSLSTAFAATTEALYVSYRY